MGGGVGREGGVNGRGSGGEGGGRWSGEVEWGRRGE